MDDSTGDREGDGDARREDGPDRPSGSPRDPHDDGDPGTDPFDRSNEPSRREPDTTSDGDRGPTAGDPVDGGSDGDRDRDEDGDAEDGQWRFGLDDVGEDGIVKPRIEPGSPKLENVVFVLLGVAAMVLLIVRLWLLI